MLRLALVLSLLLAAPARAATVTFEPGPPLDPHDHGAVSFSFVHVDAAPGETNELDIAYTDVIVVRDAGAPLTAGSGCQAQPDGSVRCPPGTPLVRAGDGNDRVLLHVDGAVDGGPGDDLLQTDGSSDLEGGDGDDVLLGDGTLFGGAGRDRLQGGAGEDHLDGGPDADVVDGGAGTDELNLIRETRPMVIDLRKAIQADGDTVTGVENVQGGSGDDRITGDGGPNQLEGGKGDDVIDGGGGDDQLDGEAGDDRVDGGPGDDILLGEHLDGGPGDDWVSTESRARSVRCGPGHDTVVFPPARLPIPPGCEAVLPSRPLDLPDVDVDKVHFGSRALELTLERDHDSGACRARLSVQARGRTLGTVGVPLQGRTWHRYPIPLSRPARDVQVVFHAGCGRLDSVTRFRLRR